MKGNTETPFTAASPAFVKLTWSHYHYQAVVARSVTRSANNDANADRRIRASRLDKRITHMAHETATRVIQSDAWARRRKRVQSKHGAH